MDGLDSARPRRFRQRQTRPVDATGLEHPGWRRPLTLGFLIISGIVSAFMLWIFSPLAEPLMWAIAFAVLVYPAHQSVLRAVGGRATLAAVVSTIAWLAIVVGPSLLAVSQLVGEARELWPRLSSLAGGNVFHDVAAWVEASPFRRLAHLALAIPDSAGADALETRFQVGVETFSAFLVGLLRKLTLSAPSAFFHMGITVITFAVLLRQGEELVRRFKELLPLHPARADALINTIAMSVHAVFRGVLLTAAAQAVLAMMGFVAAGAPVPFLLGFLTLLAALIPFVGAVAVWLPTAAGLYWTGSPAAAAGLAVWGALVVSLVDNFLRPFFIRVGMRLPMLWLFLSMIGGLQTFGLLGLLLGPAALALYTACYRIYLQDRRLARDVEDRRRSAQASDLRVDVPSAASPARSTAHPTAPETAHATPRDDAPETVHARAEPTPVLSGARRPRHQRV